MNFSFFLGIMNFFGLILNIEVKITYENSIMDILKLKSENKNELSI